MPKTDAQDTQDAPAQAVEPEPLPKQYLISPYPYFGGKARIAAEIWRRLGDVPNFVDPFMGSNALLLKRPVDHPYWQRLETVNDKDGRISNFWRAVQSAPEEVARWADWPVNENDLHARHIWLVGQKESLSDRLEGDPDYYDARIAGWWAWGVAIWIGGQFCSGDGPWQSINGRLVRLDRNTQGISRQRPHLSDAGRGVQRQIPHLGNTGRGVQRRKPHLSDSGTDVQRRSLNGLYLYFDVLSRRLRRVRVCSGDWRRVLGHSVTTVHGLTGIVLDPPYVQVGRDPGLYNHDDATLAAEVYAWAVEHGDDPLLRIACFGYEGDFEWPASWTAVRWSAHSGYGVQRKKGVNSNKWRETVWFSPHCLRVDTFDDLPLFGDIYAAETNPLDDKGDE
jgi:hypothetical protein